MELAQKIIRGVIGEAHIGAEEFLVQNGSAEKVSHLLFFHWFARECQSMASAGEDKASDATVEGSEKSEFALFEVYFHIATAEFDAVGGGEFVSGRRVDTQVVDGVVEFVRRLDRWRRIRAAP